jgi:hypothetical protein
LSGGENNNYKAPNPPHNGDRRTGPPRSLDLHRTG